MGLAKRLIDNSRSISRSKSVSLPFEISLESMSESDKYARRQDTERVKQFNADVKQWGDETTKLLRSNVSNMVDKNRQLSDSIEPNIYYDKKYAKEANRIGFSFVREGVYIHKGAGRGQGGTKGSKWYTKDGEQRETKLSSLLKMGTGNRQPKEWFDSIIAKQLPLLADIVGEYSSTLMLDTSTIYID